MEPTPTAQPGSPGLTDRARAWFRSLFDAAPTSLPGRDPEWFKVRARHLAEHPKCEACGSRWVQVHHVEPFHVNPRRELDLSNLVTLCKSHHKALGHGGDWWAWVPDVRNLAARAKASQVGPWTVYDAAKLARRYVNGAV